jgi:lysophospholipase L1-like esterase
MILKKTIKLLFTGDSITDCDRNNPAYQPFGNGYVHFAAYSLMAKYPDLEIQIINTGISGNTSTQLLNRWKKDCIDYKADIVTILIGINDLWRRYKPDKVNTAVYPEQFETNYRKMIQMVLNSCQSDIIVMEPFMFCNDENNDMFKELKHYQKICAKLASEYNITLISLQTEIDSLSGRVSSEKWSADMVHPNTWVHCWLSQRWNDIAFDKIKKYITKS